MTNKQRLKLIEKNLKEVEEITNDISVTVTGTVTYGYFHFKIPEIRQIWK